MGRSFPATRILLIRLKEAEENERLAREVLELLNHPAGAIDTIRGILQLVKKRTDFDAVGIRLKEGDDYPYYTTDGFPEDFALVESSLCARDRGGRIVRDDQGRAVLECMCGTVIRGRTDAALPFFTAYGSFWTNSTTRLLASTTEKDLQGHTRNRCNRAGYESVALIPLRKENEIIGLLQLNDRRHDRFTPETIRFFEGLGASIGIALARKRVESDREAAFEELRRSQEELRSLAALLINAQEAERSRLSRGLHDGVNQKLGMLCVDLELLEQRLPQSMQPSRSGLRALRARALRRSPRRSAAPPTSSTPPFSITWVCPWH